MGRFVLDFDDDMTRRLRAESRKRGISVNRVVSGLLERSLGRGVGEVLSASVDEISSGSSLEELWRGAMRKMPHNSSERPSYLRQSRFPDEPEHLGESGPARLKVSSDDINDVEPRIPVEAMLMRRRAAQAGKGNSGSRPDVGNPREGMSSSDGPSLAEQWKAMPNPKPVSDDVANEVNGAAPEDCD